MREKVPGLIRILFIGDIVGKPGRLAVRTLLPRLVGGEEIDFVIANGENGAGVAGLTPKVADELLENGVDLLTSGNHIWRKKEIEPYLQESPRVLRPANYPAGVVGKGHAILKTAGGTPVGVINLEGRVFMSPLESPFKVGDELLSRQRAAFGFATVAVFVGEGDLIVFYLQNTAVAQGDAEDVGGEILQGGLPIAHGLTVHHPVLLPGVGRDCLKQACLTQDVSELGPKE
ncbi:MAG: YmdB family metallophosphoesterase, partial [Deltaproteobacteria bacterium]